MPPLYHILIPAAVVVWDGLAVYAAIRLFAWVDRRPVERKPKPPPMPKPRKKPWESWDDVVDVYYDL